MINISPTTRITVGLVMIMISIFLVSDMLGLVPDRADAIKKGRTALAETLAVQYSVAAQQRDTRAIKSSMRTLVSNNDEVLSAALRETSGRLLAVAGNHDKYWTATNEQSTPVNITVPIYKGIKKWGSVEISFKPMYTQWMPGLQTYPLVSLTLFIAIAGYIAFLFFIRKTHKTVDPSSVVPSRVTHALNALAEGVLLLDSNGQIMLANTAFGKSAGIKPKKLIGSNASGLAWEFINTDEIEYPWNVAIHSGEPQTGKQLILTCKSGDKRTFMVNSSPVQDNNGENRGVLATFDDVTQLEEKNDQLEHMLGKLKFSSDKIRRQNDELQVLATRDPMTNCLNRRSFFEKYGPVFTAAKKNDRQLICIMADIDLFKSINDRFGHTAGDEVIITIAQSLQQSMRSTDTICRYGGEEFCILLPDMSLDDAMKTAERARSSIESTTIPGMTEIKVTTSFGIAMINEQVESMTQLIDQADKALYLSKNNGRNCITFWSQEDDENESGTGPSNTSGSASSSSQIDEPTHKPEHDSLTGLPNRRVFHASIVAAIEHCQTNGHFMAVMMLDLDMFKRLNNALGFKTGDRLLTSVSERLQETLRDSDSVSRLISDEESPFIYRLGGDEFGILLSSMESLEFTEQIASRIIAAVTEPLEIDSHEIHLKCSIGISVFPGNGLNADSLLDNAGSALFNAKIKGQNTYQVYDDKISNASLDRLKLENELHHAIERNELVLYYQPKVALYSGKIIGMEALIRWIHPKIGIVSPADFIPIAEESGLIVDIGEWVLKTACNKIKEWKSTDYNDVSIAVNLSAVQFRQDDFLDMIRTIISEAGIEPGLLEFEITESTIMDDIDLASAIMHELHREDVRISIDDFGTGYSSLAHLKRFPLNAVKIDRSFVRDLTTDPDDAAIIGAIIAMAHSMGLKIIAEGVETAEQLEYLRRLRCDEIQGFLFSQPLPADEAEELLKQDVNGSAFAEVKFPAAS